MKILHIMGGANAGGVAAVVYSYMKHMDQDQYHFDFALLGSNPGMLGKRMIKDGARCYELPSKSKNFKGYRNQLDALLKEEKFDAIHVHEGNTSWAALQIARLNGIKCRVAHSHSALKPTSFKRMLISGSGSYLCYHYATKLIGCGQEAGNNQFGKKYMRSAKGLVLPNAIETMDFAYNEKTRSEMRQELGISMKYVIGMVGRFAEEKNLFLH